MYFKTSPGFFLLYNHISSHFFLPFLVLPSKITDNLFYSTSFLFVADPRKKVKQNKEKAKPR